ncbi:MAG: hypothetical protein II951_11805 [Bacteroidales bacterium]|nr:hypothetical protein [Bacteroidales bacterium]
MRRRLARIAIVILSIICVGAVRAQVPPFAMVDSVMQKDVIPQCARLDSNFLRFPAGLTPEFVRLIDKLDSVVLFGRGRVSILHIGGSHVQADMYTEVFRKNIDSLNYGLRPARGYLFPYAVAKTNNPLGYKTTYRGKWDKARNARRQFKPALGMGGIAIYTHDPTAWVSIDMEREQRGRWYANSLLLLGRSHGSLLPVLTAIDGRDTLVYPSRDSLGYRFNTAGLFSQFRIGIRPDSSFSTNFLKRDTLVITGIVPENNDDGIVYHTIGVNGASVPSYLGCRLFERELKAITPDLVILAIGINDATDKDFNPEVFKSNYNTLLASMRRVSPNCAFIFITNNDSYRKAGRRRRVHNKNGAVAQAAFYDLAKTWGGAVWDLYEVMGGDQSIDTWQKAGLAQRDRVHFSREGYQIVGTLFYQAFLNFYLEQDYVGDDK